MTKPTRVRFLGGLVMAGATALIAVGCANHIGTTAASFMRRAREDPDPNVRYQAYRKLASPRCYDTEQQKAQAATLLAARLSEGKEPLASRAAICRTLGSIQRIEGREALLEAINDPDPMIRGEACRALGSIGHPEDAAPLTRIMTTDRSGDCRVAAIEGLGLIKKADPRVQILLVDAMRNDDPSIRVAAVRSLRTITGKDLGVSPDRWRQDVEVRLAAAGVDEAGTIIAGPAPPTSPPTATTPAILTPTPAPIASQAPEFAPAPGPWPDTPPLDPNLTAAQTAPAPTPGPMPAPAPAPIPGPAPAATPDPAAAFGPPPMLDPPANP
jgi:hypothetical protein